MKLTLVISLFFFVLPCSARSASLKEKLPVLEKFNLGTLDKKKLTKVFGKPTKVIDAKTLYHPPKGLGSIWEYHEGGGARLSVSFDVRGKGILGWNWEVLDDDAEKDLKKAMAEFPGASWKADTVKWVNPHQFPTECFYTDEKIGVKISYNRFRKEVTDISHWNPSRSPSSLDDAKPPRFCIEDNCTDGILAKEFFKDKPLCDLPK